MSAPAPHHPVRTFLLAVAALTIASPSLAQTRAPGFTVEQILSPAFSYGLVAAKKADRIAWIEIEKGVRNVFAAEAPGFTPVRLTDAFEDDGVDMGPLAISEAKRVLREGEGRLLRDANALEIDGFAGCFETEDQKEGMQAFLEKRPPAFKAE